MLRCRFGVVLLLALLAAGLLTQYEMNRLPEPIVTLVRTAAAHAEAGDYPAAAASAASAEALWQKNRTFTASLADHAPLEDIDSLFAQLPAYASAGDPTFSALCAELILRLKAVAEAHTLKIGSFF